MNIVEGLTFGDLLLVPKYSDIKSRSEVDLSVELSKALKVSMPLIPANMATITGIEMARAISSMGGLALLHRFTSKNIQLEWASEIGKDATKDATKRNHIGVSIGVKPQDYEMVDEFVGRGVKIFCVDIAHGHSEMGIRMTKYIADKYPNAFLISGNVCTREGAWDLWRAGADVVKIGVGAGSICTTRIQAGVGYPQLSCIENIWKTKNDCEKVFKKKLFMISDGGATSSGDCVKALCFSDLVMAGNLFAGTNETPPSSFKEIDGIFYKQYSGSSTHKDNRKEGVEAFVQAKAGISKVMNDLCEGVQSGCAYLGARNLCELKIDPRFVRLTAAGIRESGAHDVMVVK